MKTKSKRLLDKVRQLVIGPSGTPRYEDVRHVFLRKDGTLTGTVATGVLSGERVQSSSYSTRVWEVVL